MRKSRLKTVFWLLLGVLTVVCSANGSLRGQNDWSVEDQSGWVGQTGEVSWAQAVLFWNQAQMSSQDAQIEMEFGAWLDQAYMRDHENRNPQAGWDFQALLSLRPRENRDWLESGNKDMIGLDRGSSIGNALQGLKFRPEPVTTAVLMISNLMAVSVRISRKYRPRLR